MFASTSCNGRILVVDDEPQNIMLLSIRLRALGYEVLEATSGEQALECARCERLDLILSDVMMPGMDGFELTSRLKADPLQSCVPVVLITALDDVVHRIRGLAAGADDFLGKPVSPSELELRVRGQVRLRRLQEELRGRIDLLGGETANCDYSDGAKEGGKIFVLDDDERWRSFLTRRLEAEGHVVTSAGDVGSALEIVSLADPDVIIVDLRLPDGSGVDFIRKFREGRRGDYLPIVLMVSGIEETQEKLDSLRSGADDYIVKPVAPAELEARIGSQLRRARASRLLREQLAQVKLKASRDELTGLFNRGFLDEDLARRVERASSNWGGFSLAMLDVDNFKRVNDTYGHGVGDAVLKNIAALLAAAARESDLVCRYGGEELCVVLPVTGLAEAMLCLERVRAGIERLSCGPLPAGSITISIGVAEWMPGDTVGDLLRRADSAMYDAKHAGRNRVRRQTLPREIAV